MRTLAIIPAAGLGTRVQALTRGRAKEMLRLAGQPALYAALMQALQAPVDEVAVVVAAHKPELAAWLITWPHKSLPLHVVVQTEPAGVLDAVARARRVMPASRSAILFPDHLLLPGEGSLSRLLAAADAGLAPPEATWFGLIRLTEASLPFLGPTARVATASLGQGRHRIERLLPARPSVAGALHTFLVELPGSAQSAALGPSRDDRALLPALSQLAATGLLFGCELPGQPLDIGAPAGYAEARRRFSTGQACWPEVDIV